MRFTLLAASLLFSLSATAQTSLQSLKDQKRVLVVFAPNSADRRFQTQMSNLIPAQMAERDLVLVPVLAKWTGSDSALRSGHAPFTSEAGQQDVRSHFHIDSSAFTVLLIGKDGGEKLRSNIPVAMNQLNQTIDSMPMRQQERKTQPAP